MDKSSKTELKAMVLLICTLVVACQTRMPPFGTTWIRSDADTVNLTVLHDPAVGDILRWTRPRKPTVLLTYLPAALYLHTPGQEATISFRWRSDGANKCDPFDWADNKTCSCGQKIKETCDPGKGTPSCAKTSINCIEGTGDFRVALWDTSASPINADATSRGNSLAKVFGSARLSDDFCHGASGDGMHACMDKIGAKFREYQFRIMPHVSQSYFHPKDCEPGGFFAKINSTETFCDKRLPGHWGKGKQSGVFPGFGAPRGEWVNMQLKVVRKATATYHISVAMGSAKYSYEHNWSDANIEDRPTQIDALGIWFPNSRSYSYVDLASPTVDLASRTVDLASRAVDLPSPTVDMVVASTPSCPRLNVSADNLDCQGLTHHAATSKESCAAACCAATTCSVYQWCAGGKDTCDGATGTEPQCWTGAFIDCRRGRPQRKGWVGMGGSAGTPPACPKLTLAWVPSWTQVNATSNPGVSKRGMEDGIVVRRADGGLTMLSAEMYADPYAVAMQLGVFTSYNGLDWTRDRTLRRSAGTETGTDLHAAHWGPLLTRNPSNNTWMLSYVGYKAAPNNGSGFLANFQGTIFARYATEVGDAGLDSDFGEASAAPSPAYAGDHVLLAPDDFHINGPWPHRCQGLQGTDSFAPYQRADGSWAALVGTSHEEVPNPWAGKVGRWVVSVATAPELAGPWTRYNPQNLSRPADAPCSDIFPNGENPVVSSRPDDPKAFHAVYDGGTSPGFGYACSRDGLVWAPGVGIKYPATGGVRTPFGLVAMTAAEVAAREADILAYGVLNKTQLRAVNTSLQWLFLTGHSANETKPWEFFQASIVQLSW